MNEKMGSHAFHHGVDLMSPFSTLALFTIEHDAKLDLADHIRNHPNNDSMYHLLACMIMDYLVVESAPFWVGQHNQSVFVHRLYILASACNSPTGTCDSFLR